MMEVHPYLNFDGKCREAFTFYADVLGGRIAALFTFGDTPAAQHVPTEARNGIMHVRLEADGVVLMGSDAPGMYERPQGFSVSLHLTDVARAERIFNALSEG